MIRKGIIITKDGFRCLGGPGSGNFGHSGIPGQRGGSGETRSGSPHTKDAENQIDDLKEKISTEIDTFKGIKGEVEYNSGFKQGLDDTIRVINYVGESTVDVADIAEPGEITPETVKQEIIDEIDFKIDEAKTIYENSKQDVFLGKWEGLKRGKELIQ